MPNNSYARGAQYERKVKEYLESYGWFASRSAGSHGLTDVVAVAPAGENTPRTLVFIQCKTGKAKMTKAQRASLTAQALRYGASAYELSPTGGIHLTGYDALGAWFGYGKDTPWQTTPQQ